MKRFELIQWYPPLKNYFEKGDVVECVGRHDDYAKEGDNLTIPRDEVENNPEFWKRLVDYKVISFKVLKSEGATVKGDIISQYDHNTYTGKESLGSYAYDYLMDNDKFRMHSVKRLSDGEVFTVGDSVLDCNDNKRVIQRIATYSGVDENLEGVLQIHFTKGNWVVGYWDYLSNIEPAPVEPNKEYEILSIKGNLTGDIYEKGDIADLKQQYLSSESRVKIWSVKRLDDGEIFTVGDDVQVTYRNDSGKIDEIQINEERRGGLVVVLDGIQFSILNGIQFSILNIKHAPVEPNREYEILSFRNKLSETVFKKLENGNYGSNDGVGGSRLDDMLSYELCDIHSVKRLYDGEVFTVGDRIDSYCESGHITKFEMDKNKVKVHFLDDKSTHQNEWSFLNNVIKAEEWIENNNKNRYTEDEVKYALEGSTIGYTTNSNLIISKVTFETLLNLK